MKLFLIIAWSVFLTFNAVALLLKWYDNKRVWFLDLVVHFIAGILTVLTLTLWTKNLLFIASAAISVQYAWELLEFFLDRIFKSNHQRWKDGPNAGLIDSMTDMIAAICGIGITILAIALI